MSPRITHTAAAEALAGRDPVMARLVDEAGDPFRPYRSVTAWYCWRAVELYARAADSAVTR